MRTLQLGKLLTIEMPVVKVIKWVNEEALTWGYP